MSKFKPRFNKNKPKKNLVCPGCNKPHDHKQNQNWAEGLHFVCQHCLFSYTRPVDYTEYVFDMNTGAITKVKA